jgi:acyl-CoA synthetase (NDP forming)
MSRLRFALDPKSVAIIGASDNPNKVGGRPVHYLQKFGFKGKIYPINPSRTEIQGEKCYKSLADLPEAPEMVIVAVAGDNAIGAVEDCAKAGVKIALVMASGFGEVDAIAGKAKERRMVEIAHKHGMRIVGPNTQGLANFGTGAIASFSTMFMELDRVEGHVAMLSQSGALSTVPVGFLNPRGIGVRHSYATGNDSDITVGELAIAVAEDPEVKLMLLYLESIPEKKYLEELSEVALHRNLPIIALKSGRTDAGKAAAQSHTGALANEDRVVDAFLEHHGIWRAPDMRGLVEATELYLKGWKPQGRRLVAISNSGAVCVMTAVLPRPSACRWRSWHPRPTRSSRAFCRASRPPPTRSISPRRCCRTAACSATSCQSSQKIPQRMCSLSVCLWRARAMTSRPLHAIARLSPNRPASRWWSLRRSQVWPESFRRRVSRYSRPRSRRSPR